MELDFSRLNNLAFVDFPVIEGVEDGQEERKGEALDVPQEPLPKIEGYHPMPSGQGAEEIGEEGLPPLSAQRVKRMDARTLASIVAAFKESCRRCGVAYGIKEDKQGWPRVGLSSKKRGICFLGLTVKLEQEPELEAALLIELSRKDQQLKDVLEERAAIRAADGLSDDDMTVAMLTIGVDPDNPIPSYQAEAWGIQRYLTPKPESQESEEEARKRAEMERQFLDYGEWDEEDRLTA